MAVTVRRVGPEALPEIDDWIQHQFLPDMPLMTAFGVDLTQRQPSPHGPTPGTTTIYLRAEDNHGNMVGLAVVKEAVNFHEGPDSGEAWDRMAEFMDFIEHEAKLDVLPRRVELLVLSVAEGWRGRGVAKRLVLEAEVAATHAGFATLFACCTSEYAARAVRAAGWREHYKLAYSDYPGLSGRAVTLQPTPHRHVYFYVKDLTSDSDSDSD